MKVVLMLIGVGLVLAGCASGGGTYTAHSVAMPDGQQAYQVTCYGIFEGRDTCYSMAKEICDEYGGKRAVYPLQDLAPLSMSSSGKPETNTHALLFQCGAPVKPQPIAQTPPPSPAPVPVQMKKLTLSGNANFDTDKATLRPDARSQLDRLISDAQGVTFDRVTVAGYTDARASAAHNLALSARRADSVAHYLDDHGLKARQYDVHGYGKERPVASNATEQGRALNRRVEISLEGQQPQ
ncbi:OmpA family protein [Burkholderia territorii]|uniref:OmpA family protein n=1 Tax=Burkholderia territorii TaxID=1503055 RepID=UPI0007589582|nr:OmpA family protein [Burkholderia territorii]KWA08235.1 flagellar motor protein MotB [Burkholderia territorii]